MRRSSGTVARWSDGAAITRTFGNSRAMRSRVAAPVRSTTNTSAPDRCACSRRLARQRYRNSPPAPEATTTDTVGLAMSRVELAAVLVAQLEQRRLLARPPLRDDQQAVELGLVHLDVGVAAGEQLGERRDRVRVPGDHDQRAADRKSVV